MNVTCFYSCLFIFFVLYLFISEKEVVSFSFISFTSAMVLMSFSYFCVSFLHFFFSPRYQNFILKNEVSAIFPLIIIKYICVFLFFFYLYFLSKFDFKDEVNLVLHKGNSTFIFL